MKLYLLFILIFSLSNALAHGDLHERIEKTSEEIKKDPKNPDLYLKRGILYHQHNEQKKAEKDFKKSSKLGLSSAKLNYYRSKNYLALNKAQKALNTIQFNLEKDSLDLISIQLKAEIYRKTGQDLEAGALYLKVIELAEKPILTDYFFAIDAYYDGGDTNKAITITKQANEKFSKNLNILSLLIRFHKEKKEYDKAIEYCSMKINISERKEWAYMERANLYYHQKQLEKFCEDIQNMKKAISNLNERHRNTDAVRRLENLIKKTEEKCP